MTSKIRGTEKPITPDQRRTSDRRRTARDGEGKARGRRATDLAGTRSGGGSESLSSSPRKRRSTSDGREPLVVYLRPESIKALKMAALEGDTTASAIVAGAVDGWLRANTRLVRR